MRASDVIGGAIANVSREIIETVSSLFSDIKRVHGLALVS